MKVQLSDHFTVKKLIRFVTPSVVMMLFTSIYGVVDGLFVSNYAGKTAFAGMNLIMPFLMIIGTFGFMIGQGGSAIVSKTLGEGNAKRANGIFTMLVLVVAGVGILISLVSHIFLERIAVALGADEEMLVYCVQYGRIALFSMPAFMLQNVFQSFFITAGKPNLGLAMTVCAGVCNMVLDFLFVGVLRWGVVGASLATAISECIGGLTPLVYFAMRNSSLLRFTSPVWDGRALLKACTNGVSELMTNISLSVVTIIYNFQLMRLIGEDGVSAYGVIMYAGFLFVSVYLGYSIGVAPVVGFHYGARNTAELQNLFRKSLCSVGLISVVLTVLSLLLAAPLVRFYVGYDAALYDLTLRGYRIYTLSFLLAGINIYASSFFTALSNGAVSAAISFLRTLFFQLIAVFLMPLLFGTDGIFAATVVSELMAILVSLFFFAKMNRRYEYMKRR